MEKREKRIPVLVSDQEWRDLQMAADKSGLKVSTYIRQKALEALRKQGEQ